MMLSTHFSLAEFVHSQAAARAGRELVIPEQFVPHAERLCVHVLEPLRAALGRPVQISSGYRDDVVNRLVGGAATSAHVEARAADIIVPGLEPYAVAKVLEAMELVYLDKCILEFDAWVHVQIARSAPAVARHEFLTARRIGGKVYYFDRLLRKGEAP